MWVIEQLVVDGTVWSRTKKKSMLMGIFCQLSEVCIHWSAQAVSSPVPTPACAQRHSARLGLHPVAWTRGTSVLGCRIVTLSPPFLGARSASRPGAPAAPTTIRLGSYMDDFPGNKVSIPAAARMVKSEARPTALEWSISSPLGKCLGIANQDLCACCLALNLKLWVE